MIAGDGADTIVDGGVSLEVGTRMQPCTCGQRRVLIVDDDDAIRDTLAELIAEEGCSVATARDGADALNHLHRSHACLVLLDLMMPGISGWQMLATMLADEGLATTPVCVITAVQTHAPLGTVAVLPKPLNLDRLLELLHTFAGASAAPPATPL